MFCFRHVEIRGLGLCVSALQALGRVGMVFGGFGGGFFLGQNCFFMSGLDFLQRGQLILGVKWD